MECHLELPHQRNQKWNVTSSCPIREVQNPNLNKMAGTKGKVAHAPETTRPLDIKSRTVFHRLGNRSRITIICCPDDENLGTKAGLRASRTHASEMALKPRDYLFLVREEDSLYGARWDTETTRLPLPR